MAQRRRLYVFGPNSGLNNEIKNLILKKIRGRFSFIAMDAHTKKFFDACDEFFKTEISLLKSTCASQEIQIQDLKLAITALQREHGFLEEYESCCLADMMSSVEKSIRVPQNYRKMYASEYFGECDIKKCFFREVCISCPRVFFEKFSNKWTEYVPKAARPKYTSYKKTYNLDIFKQSFFGKQVVVARQFPSCNHIVIRIKIDEATPARVLYSDTLHTLVLSYDTYSPDTPNFVRPFRATRKQQGQRIDKHKKFQQYLLDK